MADNESLGPGGLLVAFLAGAVVGAAVALLYAPASGEEARDYLARRAREGRERVADAVEQARQQAGAAGEGENT
jgi:gas vesicle protein